MRQPWTEGWLDNRDSIVCRTQLACRWWRVGEAGGSPLGGGICPPHLRSEPVGYPAVRAPNTACCPRGIWAIVLACRLASRAGRLDG
jgi:hypothetical protein